LFQGFPFSFLGHRTSNLTSDYLLAGCVPNRTLGGKQHVNAVFSGLKPVLLTFGASKLPIRDDSNVAFCNLVNPDYVLRSAYSALQRSRFAPAKEKVLMGAL